MKGARKHACLLLALTMAMAGHSAAKAAESPSYTAYAQGQYITALKLAEKEASEGSKEDLTVMG